MINNHTLEKSTLLGNSRTFRRAYSAPITSENTSPVRNTIQFPALSQPCAKNILAFIEEANNSCSAHGSNPIILEGSISKHKGFLEGPDISSKLPAQFKPWEDIAQNLPFLNTTFSARVAIDSMPILSAEHLPEIHLPRASLILSALAHSYFYHHRNEDGSTDCALPAPLSEPWKQVTHRLGRPFMARAGLDDFINNTVKPIATEPQLYVPYFSPSIHEESATAGFQALLEQEFSMCIPMIIEIQEGVIENNIGLVTKKLFELASKIQDLSVEILSMSPKEGLGAIDPVIWFRTYPEMGHPVSDEEVDNSGVDAPLFHALDSFFGRAEDLENPGELKHQQGMRLKRFSPVHRSFIRALKDQSCAINAFSNNSDNTELKNALLQAKSAYTHLLETHRKKAIGSIEPMLATGRTNTAGRTSQKESDRPAKVASLVERINFQMTKAINDRFGVIDTTIDATISKIWEGPTLCVYDLALDKAIACKPGDRILVQPENSTNDIEKFISEISVSHPSLTRFKTQLSEKLKTADLKCISAAQLSEFSRLATEENDISNLSFTALKKRNYSISKITPSETGGIKKIQLVVSKSKNAYSPNFLSKCENSGNTLQITPHIASTFRVPNNQAPVVYFAQGSGIASFASILNHEAADTTRHLYLVAGFKTLNDVPYLQDMTTNSYRINFSAAIALSSESRVAFIENGSIHFKNFDGRPHVDDIIKSGLPPLNNLMSSSPNIFVCGSNDFSKTVHSSLMNQIDDPLHPNADPSELPTALPYNRRLHEETYSKKVEQADTFYPIHQVAMHNSANDLWTIIGDNIYDLSQYATRHPGGIKVLMQYGGTFADKKLAQIHGMDDQMIESTLQSCKVGKIIQYDMRLERKQRHTTLYSELLRILEAQNTFNISTQFTAGRQIPYFLLEPSLKSTPKLLRDVLIGDNPSKTTQKLEGAISSLENRIFKFSEISRQALIEASTSTDKEKARIIDHLLTSQINHFFTLAGDIIQTQKESIIDILSTNGDTGSPEDKHDIDSKLKHLEDALTIRGH